MSLTYFSYGANKDPEMMEAITGKKPSEGTPAVLKGFNLCVQKLESIPKRPQKILRRAWGNDFESYAIKKGDGKVHGTLWKITEEERQCVDSWELVREGWFNKETVTVTTKKGEKVKAITEVITDQKIDRIEKRKNYPSFIMPKNQLLSIARKVRPKIN